MITTVYKDGVWHGEARTLSRPARHARVHTSLISLRRQLVWAMRSACAGDYDLLLHYLQAALAACPRSWPGRRRLINLNRRMRASRCRDWFIRLARRGYRPVYPGRAGGSR